VSRPRLALPIAVLVAAAATIASACSTVAGPAWRVGDVSVSVDQFFADYQASLSESASTSTTGPRIETTELASFMTNEIQEQLLTQGLAEKGITVTQEDRDSAELAYQNQAAQTGGPATPTPEQIEIQAGVAALGRALAEEGAESGIVDIDAAARDLYEQRKDSLVEPGQTCAHFILIPAGDLQNATTPPTDADYEAARVAAEEVVTRLATEDFAAVSKEVSAIEEQLPGGDFGCQPLSAFPSEVVPIIEDLESGVLSAPTRIEGGYLISRVDSRTEASEPPSFEEVEDQARAAVLSQLGQQLVGEWLLDRSRQAYVVVDARFGTWDPETAQVTPPEGAATPTVPTSVLGIDPSPTGGIGSGPAPSATAGS
jgi:parvulin-like peptidyl-prolyl isomerase